ncbi:MAG TPA: Gfo/Idh/MocA family oxidoreductase [Acidimicrobiales bacterium]|nr:Gfo/Idh/MocA family oxidoreductase [Acidimicrobiales bacterium]
MTTRTALVGCGFIGGVHSTALRALGTAGLVDARVASTYDPDPARAARLAAAHPGCTAAGTLGQALDGADAVWVCTPTSSHLEVVAAACDRGLAVFCEKPLAPGLAESKALVDRVAAAGVPAQVGLVLRSAPVFARLHEALQDAAANGPVMSAVFRDDQFFPIQGHYASTWRADRAVAGGGALIEHSIHDLDALSWLLGPVTEVSAVTANHAGHPGIEDVAHVTLTHASGARSALVSLWHGILSRPSTRRLEVFCRDRLYWLDDDMTGPLHVEGPGGPEPDRGPGPDFLELAAALPVPEEWRVALAGYAAADRAFLDAVAGGRPPAPGLADALRAHVLVDAVYRSAEAGTPVNVALL